jgi:beta-mannosidase
MQSQSLNGQWQVRHEALAAIGLAGLRVVNETKTGWIPAAVPGEVHLDLMAAGLMEEPFFSTNTPACRWVEDRSWWFRTRFTVDPAVAAEQVKELVCEGLDHYAQVFLNGQLIGESRNSLVAAAFEIHHQLKEGENELVLRLTAGSELARDQRMGTDDGEQEFCRRGFKGVAELRKPAFSYGWDWIDGLPNIGIWRGVRIEGRSRVRLHDVRHAVEFTNDHRCCQLRLCVDTLNLHPSREYLGRTWVRLLAPDGRPVVEAAADRFFNVGIDRWQIEMEVPQPQLWWPNGMGAQPLYTLEVAAEADGAERDRWTRRIGLRTVAIDRSPLPEGHRFVIRINDQEVFCRGANWVPADGILARVTVARLEHLVDEAAEANLNMLRIWGGGIYEDDAFYDACDRRGILIWHDFMFAVTPPDDRKEYRDLVRDEAEAVIRRLRHHPSIALWCANNEQTWGFSEWWGNYTLDYPHRDLKIDGRHVFSRILPEACLELDPERPYWPGSPAGGERPNNYTEGDCHYWKSLHKDVEQRISHEIYDTCRGRFVSEYGFVGASNLESIRTWLRPAELDRNHRAWITHSNQFERNTTQVAIARFYADLDGLATEHYVRLSQMFQATMYGRTMDAFRFRKHDPADDCAGALIWMWNDCWGENGWTPIDHCLRRKPSWYAIRRACLPVRAIVRRRENALVTRVVNDTREERRLTVHHGWMRLDGSAREVTVRELTVPANGMVEAARSPIPESSAMPHEEWLYAAWAEGEGMEPLPSIWTLLPHRRLRTVEPQLDVHREDGRITLTSSAYAHAVGHDDDGGSCLSDDWFDLLPGLPKTIVCNGANPDAVRFMYARPNGVIVPAITPVDGQELGQARTGTF